VDYDNGGGTVAVWTNNTCNSAPAATYPSSGFATDIFGGDIYQYNAATPSSPSVSGNIVATTTININSTGLISY
jgi:hypothetical protein